MCEFQLKTFKKIYGKLPTECEEQISICVPRISTKFRMLTSQPRSVLIQSSLASDVSPSTFPVIESPSVLQIQRSAQSNATYDLFIVVELGGLQQRKYLIKFSEKECSGTLKCGWTYEAKGVLFERLNVRDWLKTGRRLLPVLNQCYKLMFDQDTNLLHSITYL